MKQRQKYINKNSTSHFETLLKTKNNKIADLESQLLELSLSQKTKEDYWERLYKGELEKWKIQYKQKTLDELRMKMGDSHGLMIVNRPDPYHLDQNGDLIVENFKERVS